MILTQQTFSLFKEPRPVSSIIAKSGGNAFINDDKIICLDNDIGAKFLILNTNGKCELEVSFTQRPIKLLGKLANEKMLVISQSEYAGDLVGHIYNTRTHQVEINFLLGQHDLAGLAYTMYGDVILTDKSYLNMPGAESESYLETSFYYHNYPVSFLHHLCCNNHAKRKKLDIDINFFEVTPNNHAIAIKQNRDNSVEFCSWDLTSLNKLSTSYANIGKIENVYAVSEDLVLLSLVNHDNLLWDIKQNKCLGNLSPANNDISKITSFKLLSSGDFATGHLSGELKIWDGRTFQCKNTFHEHVGLINSIDQFSNGDLLTGSSDNTLRVWEKAAYLDASLVVDRACRK